MSLFTIRLAGTMAGVAEIGELTKSLGHAHHEIDKLKELLDKALANDADFERRLSLLEKENAEIRAYAEDLEDYILTLDSATRKRNLIIAGLAEEKNESNESIALRVFNFLQPFVETLEFSDMDCAYRLGNPSHSTAKSQRPILCKFVKERVRNQVASIRPNLNDEDSETRIYLNDDLPQLLNDRRATFRTIMRLAKSKKIPASMQGNKITVNNITYTHKNLDCLPAGVTLEDAKMVPVKGGIAFQSEHAWPSNFFPTKIELQGMTFASAEHAYQYSRATKLGKTGLAKMIMRAKNGKAAKQLGSQVDSNDKWDSVKIDVMRVIITEKFMQNPVLCDKLVGSGQTTLIEATLDGFWGARATPTSKSLKQGTWTGANFLGKILAETRDELRRELGLPDPDVSNATMHAPMELGTQPTASAAPPATATPARASNASQQTADLSKSSMEVESGQGTQTDRPNRKNKEHQSPIPSPGKSPAPHLSNKKKKARVFSPKSELPPKNRIADLFSAVLETDLHSDATLV